MPTSALEASCIRTARSRFFVPRWIEATPPQCSATIIELNATIDVVLAHVAESFGSPEDAKINIDQGVYWTDEWVNVAGTLENNRLTLRE